MPKVKQVEKLKHPNSRKTKVALKHIQRKHTKNQKHLQSFLKSNVTGEKIRWFQSKLLPEWDRCTPDAFQELIQEYLNRFQEELEQIQIKYSIGCRKGHQQHSSREKVLKMTLAREKEEYEGCGLELPDLLDAHQFRLLKEWNGELRYLQKFHLKRFSKKHLEEKINLQNIAS